MNIDIEVYIGDITESEADAIVNAANNHLWMGSGVAGAIKRKGGHIIEKEAMAQGPIEVGQAIATQAGELPYKFILHAAGMGQDLTTNSTMVYETTVNTLFLANELLIKTIAFPAIGTGVGGLELSECATVMIKAIRDKQDELINIEKIKFALFDKSAFEAFKKILEN